MPNGNQDGYLVVSWNKSVARDVIEKDPVLEISNFQELIDKTFSAVKLASAFGIYIPMTTYFFHIKREENNSSIVKVSTDDVDEVEKVCMAKDLSKLNMKAAKEALEIFIGFAVSEPMRSMYIDQIERRSAEWASDIDYFVNKINDC
jgi:hypothetical protein